jgi:hypothetical protein
MQSEQVRIPNANQPLIDTIEQELQTINQDLAPTIYALVENELFKLRGGVTEIIDLIGGSDKIKVRAKVHIPQDNQNYVGRLIGPKGENLKTLQTNTLTKMAILGHGSMRDSQKENELLASGDPKYQHLKQNLHLQIDSLASPSEAYYRMSHAIAEIQKTLSDFAASLTPNPGWGQPQGAPGFPPTGMARGGGAPRGRGGAPPTPVSPGYSAPGLYMPPGPPAPPFGNNYGNGNAAGGKMPPMRGRGMSSRPYSRGRGGQP